MTAGNLGAGDHRRRHRRLTLEEGLSAPAPKEATAATHAGALLGAAVLFGLTNLAWRLGEGDTVAIVLQRSLIGVALVLPVLWRAGRDGRLRALSGDKWAVAAVLTSGATLTASGFLFRWLPGPQAGLVLAVAPALLLLPSRLLTGRTAGITLPFVLLSVLAAMGAATTGGVGEVTTPGLLAAVCFLATTMAASLTMEHARGRHSSWVLVAGGMVAGTVGSAVALLLLRPETPWSVPGLLVAVLIAVLATGGRVLQAFSLPHLGSVVTATSGQVSAAITVVGGILFFDDVASRWAVILGTVAACASVAATVLAGRSYGPGSPYLTSRRR